jgi:hypothetical protein
MLINYSYYNKYARKKIINIDYPCGTAYFYIMDDISLQLLHELSSIT